MKKYVVLVRYKVLLLEILICLPYVQNRLISQKLQQKKQHLPFLSSAEHKAIKNIFFPFFPVIVFRCCLQKAHWSVLDSHLCTIQGWVILLLLKFQRTKVLFLDIITKNKKFYKTKPGKRKQNLKVNLATYQTYQAFIIRLWEFWKSNGSLTSVGCWKKLSGNKKTN